jgi:hypothetical protein
MSAKDGGPAFPREDYQADDAPGQRGMSLRGYYAGQALQGILASNAHPQSNGALPVDKEAALFTARGCFQYADAMIEAGKEGRP